MLVSYVFGPGLPASGRCVTSKAELSRAARGASGDSPATSSRCARPCSWNHLAHNFVVNHRRRARA